MGLSSIDELLQMLGIKFDPGMLYHNVYHRDSNQFTDQMNAYARSMPIHSYEHDGVHYEVFDK